MSTRDRAWRIRFNFAPAAIAPAILTLLAEISRREDMSGESKTTTDHKTIQKWVEERGGHPATVKGTGDGDEAGVLRIDYPGYTGENRLEEITWDEFFAKFDEEGLAFLYQETTKDGEQSRFSKLVANEAKSAKP
jgi:hypothetical protein